MPWDKIWYVKCEKYLWKEKQKCEELRKRRVDVCCKHKVRWKGQGAHFVGTLGGNDCCSQEMTHDLEGLEF